MTPAKPSVSDFLNQPEIVACLAELKTKFRDRPFLVSDVIDDQGHQYVHLVQKGGGVLGVALVGYTYILEKMGVRFLKQAGTSAGAINTALMSVIDTKKDAKSEKVLQAICDLEFFSLVDGHPFARRIIKRFLTTQNYFKKVRNLVIGWFAIHILLFITDIVISAWMPNNPGIRPTASALFLITAVMTVVTVIVGWYFRGLMGKLKSSGYGLNPGKTFFKWVKDLFEANGVFRVSDLYKKTEAPVPGLRLRDPQDTDMSDLVGAVKLISSELSSENKIIFPEMCGLFRKPEDIDTLEPAGFVRASMSIPVFFESYIIKDIPCYDPAIAKKWKDELSEDDAPSKARFVDGGLLSNFPMSVFYNPKRLRPRLPVFGIDLDTDAGGDSGKNAESWSFAGYLSKMFNTLQTNSDKEFLLKNQVYELGVGKVDCSGYNWLNFFLSGEDKMKLFVAGAKSATEFLGRFEWEAYKNKRADLQLNLEKSAP